VNPPTFEKEQPAVMMICTHRDAPVCAQYSDIFTWLEYVAFVCGQQMK